MKPSVCVLCPTMNNHHRLPNLIDEFEKQTFPKDDLMLLIVDETPTPFDLKHTNQSSSIVYVHLPSKATKTITDLEDTVRKMTTELNHVQKEIDTKKNRQKELTALISKEESNTEQVAPTTSTKRIEFRALIDSIDSLLKKTKEIETKLKATTNSLQNERKTCTAYTPSTMQQVRQIAKDMAIHEYGVEYCICMNELDTFSSKYVSSMVDCMKTRNASLVGFNAHRVKHNRLNVAYALNKVETKCLHRFHLVSFTREYGLKHDYIAHDSFIDSSAMLYVRADNLVLCNLDPSMYKNVQRFFTSSNKISRSM